jgi:hypothetical protein
MKTRMVLTTLLILIVTSIFGQIKVFNDNHISLGSLQKWGQGIQIADNRVSYFNPGVYTEYSWLNMTNSTNNLAKNWIVSQNNVHNFFVYGNGQVYSKGNFICADESTLTNIAEIQSPLDKILQLHAVLFKYKLNEQFDTIRFTDKEGNFIIIPPGIPFPDSAHVNMEIVGQLREEKDLQHIGFISKEVRRVLPEAVRMQPDGIDAVDYNSLVGLLIEAVKEQQDKIEQLQTLMSSSHNLLKVEPIKHDENVNVLFQNAPNPFNEQTIIHYKITTLAKQASILVFNLQGNLLLTFRDLTTEGDLILNSRELSAGMYLYSLIVDNAEIDTKRMILTE